MLKLILVRHATTLHNEQRKFTGFEESAVSAKGYHEIAKLTKMLEAYAIDVIYTSPAKRTIATIQPVAIKKQLTIQLVPEFREIHFGDFEGMDFETLKTHYPEEIDKMMTLGDAYQYPQGESLIEAYRRTSRKLDDLIRKNEGKTVVICAHGGTLRNILSHLIGKDHRLHWHFKINNASVSIVTLENDFPVIEVLNLPI